MYVEIYLINNSKPSIYECAEDTFQEGDFYCVHYKNDDESEKVDKYPIVNIDRVEEDAT